MALAILFVYVRDIKRTEDTPSTILRMVSLPQEGGINAANQKEEILVSDKVL